LIPAEKKIVLVTEDDEQVAETRMRLARVGLENVAGYLDGGMLAWHDSGRAVAVTEQISVDELNHRLAEGKAGQLLDVRRPGEWQAGHIAQARHLPLNELPGRASEVAREGPITAICAGGYRSSIATSLLERQGFGRVTNVVGGMAAWTNAGLQTVT
jgi:hydroxyacylglutathione hydrolase